MLSKIICLVVLVLPLGLRAGDIDEFPPDYLGEDDDDGFRSHHKDNVEDTYPVRIKRLQLQAKATIKTLSPLEIQQVKGAIQQILSGHNQNNPFTPLPPRANDKREVETRYQKQRSAQSPNEDRFTAHTKFTEDIYVIDATDSEAQTKELLTTDTTLKSSTTINEDETEPNEDFTKSTVNIFNFMPVIPDTDKIKPDLSVTTDDLTENSVTKTTETIYYETETNTGLTGATTNEMLLATLPPIGRTDKGNESPFTTLTPFFYVDTEPVSLTMERIPTSSDLEEETMDKKPKTVAMSKNDEIEGGSDKGGHGHEGEHVDEHEGQHSTEDEDKHKHETEDEGKHEKDDEDKHGHETDEGKHETDDEDKHGHESESEDEYGHRKTTKKSKKKTKRPKKTTTTRRMRRNRTRTTTTTPTTTTQFRLDVPALLAIIANLTFDYEVNLTDKLNKTLMQYSIPTCETPTTTVKRGIFIDYDANATGTIVAKCFVCGLENYGIPRDAHCGDAFAGDFLPLMPMDMTARGRISKFRKYCRYADVPGIIKNMSQPRSVFGRWTGGCSVRWIDLSNVYTQRSCRSKDRAIMGKNFASKRMAKLEMALKHVDNGCIASPMATLVPLSRGISLYARFHACVCTGSWCNDADGLVPWTTSLLLTFVYFSSFFIT